MSDGVSGYYVGWTAAGEWLKYTIAVTKGMKVNFTLLLGCTNEVSVGSGTVFSVSGLSAGTYIVCWIVDGKVFRDKIIKL